MRRCEALGDFGGRRHGLVDGHLADRSSHLVASKAAKNHSIDFLIDLMGS